MADTLLTPADLAKRWSVAEKTLQKRRTRGQPPRFIRIGDGPRGRVRYRLADVEAFENQEKPDGRADP